MVPGVDQLDEIDEPDLLAEAVAEQLLARWGVVIRDICAREQLALPWREVQWALRRLEARGTIKGGRFLAGFSGEQFALPEAAELLTQIRKTAHQGQRVQINACDPLNLTGVLFPGPRVPALRTNTITYTDGLPGHSKLPRADS